MTETLCACDRCGKGIPLQWPDAENTDNGLNLILSGGYGEFHDDGYSGATALWLCHECGHELAEFLGLDVHNWHTHRSGGTQHPDHHDKGFPA